MKISKLKGTYSFATVLPVSDCQEITTQVLAMKKSWSIMGSGISLGVAWYKWIEDGMLNNYHAIAPSKNKMLESAFPGFRHTLLHAAREAIGLDLPLVSRSSKFGGRWGRYGITVGNETTDIKDDQDVSSDGKLIVHMDFEGLSPYPEMMFDENTQAFSIVLSLSIPESGGGLKIYPKRVLGDYYNAPSLSAGDNGDKNFKKLICDEVVQPVFLDYKPGTLAVFDSFLPHGIMPMIVTDTFRIAAVTHLLVKHDPVDHLEYWF